MSGANTQKGRLMVLSLSIDSGSTYLPIAGINARTVNRDNPVSDTTSQTDTGGESSSAFNGYATVTINGSGFVDTSTDAGQTDWDTLSALAFSADPSGFFELSDGIETIDGEFNITSFEKTGEQNGQSEFTFTLQNCGDINFAQP